MHDRISPGALRTLHRNKWTISATRGKRLNQLVVRPRDSQIRSDLLEVLDDLGIERDARLPMFVHEREALLPVHIDPLLSMGLRAVLELPREAARVPPQFVYRAERRGTERHEERPHVGLFLNRVHLEYARRTAEHASGDRSHQ